MKIVVIRMKPLQKKKVNKALVSEIIISSTVLALCMAEPVLGADLSKLDKGGWAIVSLFQRIIFWTSMIYAFKALLEVTVKGEGSWKKVASGGLICVSAYLIPTLWQVIQESFK